MQAMLVAENRLPRTTQHLNKCNRKKIILFDSLVGKEEEQEEIVVLLEGEQVEANGNGDDSRGREGTDGRGKSGIAATLIEG